MQHYTIGIDTGGTCTDAVLVEQHTNQILASAKVATTHYRLSDGISSALWTIMDKSGLQPDRINAIAISTTLATNSVVEKKGARVVLFVIGYVKHFKLPVKAIIYLNGGHTIKGVEEEPLELDYLVESLEKLSPEADAYAVCSAMSMTNPTHELVAEKAISLIDPKPVFCSHRASGQTGMKERAATAALHAQLMPVMQEFLNSVEQAMQALELTCPLTIITGNGSSLTPEEAVKQAGMTVASGPACTALYGAYNTNSASLVIDVGGTTTDIAMVENGLPVLANDGCIIDSWTTHMPSVDMYTGGIGGDSLVVFEKDQTLTIGPTRVVPLAMSSDTSDPALWIGPGKESRCISLEPAVPPDTRTKDPILKWLGETEPATIPVLIRKTKLSTIPLNRKLEQLSRKQLIREIGFTPTDALHALDLANFGNKARSLRGAEILSQAAGMTMKTFCRAVIEQTEDQIINLIIRFATRKSWGDSLSGFLSSYHQHQLITVDFGLKVPLVGLGAAAPFFLPAVAKKLATTVSFPPYSDVGNGVGATGVSGKK